MKTKTLLSILAVGLIVSAFGQKPTMELTFTAENNGQYVPMDSIFIENLTQGGDTTLYAPDTIMVLDYNTSIYENVVIAENTFSVSQNYPNPFNGKTDIKNKIIRFVGEPEKRLFEDPIRALRACRFAALTGGKIEDKSKEVILQNHSLLKKVARERIQLELNKILMLNDRESALFLLSELHLLEEITPSLAKSIDVPQNGYHAEDCWTHAVKATQAVEKKDLKLRLSALFHDIAKPKSRTRDEEGIDHFYGHETKGVKMVEKELRDLKYSLHTIDYVKEATRYHMTRIMFVPEMKDATIRRLMGRLNCISIRDILRLQIADMRGNLREPFTLDEQIKLLRYVLKRIRRIEKEDHALKITDLAINGDDIMKIFKIKPGRKLGKALQYCLEEVLKKPELNTKGRLVFLLGKKIFNYEK